MAEISIIVPVYNTAAYLPECIQSLIDQSFYDIEILLIDDGSGDNSLAICRRYAEKDRRILVIAKENGGVSSARNAGLDMASGNYLIFVDSDDIAAESMCARLYAMIRENRADFASGGYCFLYGNKRVRKAPRIPRGQYCTEDAALIDDGTLSGMLFGAVWASVYKKGIIEKNNLRFDDKIRYNEDGLFALHYLMQCETFYVDQEEALYIYRQRSDSATHRKGLADTGKYDAVQKSLGQIAQAYPAFGFSQQLKKRTVSVALWLIIETGRASDSFVSAWRRIDRICQDTTLRECLPLINAKKLNIYKRFFYWQMVHENAFLLTVGARYLLPVLQKLLPR